MVSTKKAMAYLSLFSFCNTPVNSIITYPKARMMMSGVNMVKSQNRKRFYTVLFWEAGFDKYDQLFQIPKILMSAHERYLTSLYSRLSTSRREIIQHAMKLRDGQEEYFVNRQKSRDLNKALGAVDKKLEDARYALRSASVDTPFYREVINLIKQMEEEKRVLVEKKSIVDPHVVIYMKAKSSFIEKMETMDRIEEEINDVSGAALPLSMERVKDKEYMLNHELGKLFQDGTNVRKKIHISGVNEKVLRDFLKEDQRFVSIGKHWPEWGPIEEQRKKDGKKIWRHATGVEVEEEEKVNVGFTYKVGEKRPNVVLNRGPLLVPKEPMRRPVNQPVLPRAKPAQPVIPPPPPVVIAPPPVVIPPPPVEPQQQPVEPQPQPVETQWEHVKERVNVGTEEIPLMIDFDYHVWRGEPFETSYTKPDEFAFVLPVDKHGCVEGMEEVDGTLYLSDISPTDTKAEAEAKLLHITFEALRSGKRLQPVAMGDNGISYRGMFMPRKWLDKYAWEIPTVESGDPYSMEEHQIENTPTYKASRTSFIELDEPLDLSFFTKLPPDELGLGRIPYQVVNKFYKYQ